MIALGLIGYMRDNGNLFDLSIVIVSGVEVRRTDRLSLEGNEIAQCTCTETKLPTHLHLSSVSNGFACPIVPYQPLRRGLGHSLHVQKFIVAPPVILTGGVPATGNSAAGVVTAFRCLRLVRIFRMARRWTSMADLIGRCRKTVDDVGNVALLMALTLFVFALLGMQLFANKLRVDPETGYPLKIGTAKWFEATTPRANFDTLGETTITLFQV